MRALQESPAHGLARRVVWPRAYWAGAAEMELMEMSCRRPGEAWSVPALAAPAVAGEQVARPAPARLVMKACSASIGPLPDGSSDRPRT
jgi:hypothetical protein